MSCRTFLGYDEKIDGVSEIFSFDKPLELFYLTHVVPTRG